jgi:RHS repeat-associated protein
MYNELSFLNGIGCSIPTDMRRSDTINYSGSYTFKLDCKGQLKAKNVNLTGSSWGTSELLINGIGSTAGGNNWIVPVTGRCGDLVTLTPTAIGGYGCAYINSISAQYEPACDLKIASLDGSRKIINPETGGEIKLNGSISDSSGQPIFWTLTVLGKTFTGSGTAVNVTWDGKYADGTVVRPGSYSATLSAQTADGQCMDSKAVNITVTPAPDGQCGLYVQFGSSAHMANGNLAHTQELFSSQSGSVSAGVTLYYNSLDPADSTMGRGWSHSYNMSLKENSDGSVLVSEPNWKYDYFTLANSSYSSSSGNYSILAKKADGSFILTRKDSTVSIFSSNGKLISIADRNGNTTYLSHTGNNLVTVTDPAGRIIIFAYDTANRLTSVTDPSGNVYVFSVTGNSLVSLTQPDGGVWKYAYDANNFMITKTDPLGNLTTYTYDGKHRVVSSLDPEGKMRSITYPQPGTDVTKTTTFTEKDGGQWLYNYDTQKGYLLGKTDPRGGTTAYTYDNNSNRTSTTGPDGTATSSTYDNAGNMLTSTDALGQTTSYTYNTFGQVTSITDPQGGTTAYGYDAKGNMTLLTDPSGATTKYEYDARGNVIKVTDPAGQATAFTYDAQGNLATVTDPSGATTTYTYDTAGNVISITDARGAVTKFAYDVRNRLIKTIDPNGNATTYTYNFNGNKTSETDANGNVTTYKYNSHNQLIKTIDALGNITTYTYDGSTCPSCGGNGEKLTSLSDANNNVTSYSYNQLGHLMKETDPLGNITSYAYNAKGNLTSKTDANGNTINYSYDANGRLLKKIYPDATEETFTYDPKGNILSAVNKNISYAFSYDAVGRMQSSTDSNGKVIQYSYDNTGRKTRTTYPEGSVVSYAYDTAGRLATITNGGGRQYGYSYDNLGRRTKLAYPNGATASYNYDTAGRLLSLVHKTSTGKIIGSFAYTHDKVGNRLTKAEPDVTYTYGYDTIYRLLQALPAKPREQRDEKGENEHHDRMVRAEQYTYDPAGNRLTGPRIPAAYAYGPGNQLLTTSRFAYTYDINGNTIAKTHPEQNGEHQDYDDDNRDDKNWTYTYDYENRLIKAETTHEDETIVVSFKYDPFGRRIEKKVETIEHGKAEEVKTYTFVYDGQAIILEYLTKLDDGEAKTDVTKYVHGPGIDEPLSITKNGEIYYYHADGLGSIVALTDKKQKVVESYEYDSFGNMKRHGDKVKNTITYTGREWDKETGLYYYRARYYDPMEGRFISRDPIGFDGGDVNLYAYVKNNPTNLTDPSGKNPWYGNYCGPGYYSAPPIDELDAACQQHDACYTVNDFGWKDVVKPPTEADACNNKNKCDKELRDAAMRFQPYDDKSRRAKDMVLRIF